MTSDVDDIIRPADGPPDPRLPRVRLGPLARAGAFACRRAKLVLGLSVVLLAVAGVLGMGAFGKLAPGGFEDAGSPSSQASQRIAAQFGGQANLILLVHARSGQVADAPVRAAGEALTEQLRREPFVSGVVSFWEHHAPGLRSGDGRDALITARVLGDDKQVGQRAKALLARYVSERGAISVQAGGQAAVNREVRAQVSRSLALAEGIAIPLTMVLLVLVFGNLSAAILPLVVGGVAVLGTFAELSVLGSLTTVSVFTINLTTALGLALGVDYALLIVNRFREQISAGDSVPDAVVTTVRTAGRTIVFSAATVAVALGALLVFPLYFLRSFAYAGIGVVAIAALGALTVAPAMLALLGARVARGRRRLSGGGYSGGWHRIATLVVRRPVLTALPALAVLTVAALPLLGASFGTPDQDVLRAGNPSRQVARALATEFGGDTSSPLDIVTTAPAAPNAVESYATRLAALPGVARVTTSVGTFVPGRVSPVSGPEAGMRTAAAERISVVTTLPTKSASAQRLVGQVRAIPGPAGVATLVGGEDARLVDTKHAIASRLPIAAALIVATTFVLLFLFTGSVVQPVRALLLNGLGLAAALGVMTWMFQDGHLGSVFGFTARPMDTAMTVLLFCIGFGLSMDYEVFLTSRIKEFHDQGESTGAATVRGLARTGRIISAAACLLAVSFFAFGTSTVSFLQMFGLGSGLAVLIDAVVLRAVLVPAVTRLLGERIWYAPRPLRRLHRRLGLRESG